MQTRRRNTHPRQAVKNMSSYRHLGNGVVSGKAQRGHQPTGGEVPRHRANRRNIKTKVRLYTVHAARKRNQKTQGTCKQGHTLGNQSTTLAESSWNT